MSTQRTHHPECWRYHHECAVDRAERLEAERDDAREALRAVMRALDEVDDYEAALDTAREIIREALDEVPF